jgi:glycine/D-amino acid oxidase-like deaminating enzyme
VADAAVDVADVVVVGAGALGLSTALHLSLLGRTVVVVERDSAGSQASGRAAGLFKSIQADPLRTSLARRSIERARTFEAWAGVPLDVRPAGSLAIARTPEHSAFLAAEVAASQGLGVAIEELTADGLRDRSSLYRPTGGERSWWCPEDVYIEEPMALVAALVAACRQHGVDLREREEVIGIDVHAGHVVAVETSRGRIGTTQVVDAAGAWTREVGALAGAWLPVTPVRHQLRITEPDPSVDATAPIVRVIDAAVYVRPARGGLMGGGFEAQPAAVAPGARPPRSTDDVDLDPAVLDTMVRAVEDELPSARGPVAEHRGGLFTMTPDGRFLAGEAPGLRGLWVASGCNGSGFSSSLAIGEALAGQLVGAPVLDLSPLAPSRVPVMDDTGLVRAGVWQYAHYYDPSPAT